METHTGTLISLAFQKNFAMVISGIRRKKGQLESVYNEILVLASTKYFVLCGTVLSVRCHHIISYYQRARLEKLNG